MDQSNGSETGGRRGNGTRCVAIVGPYLCGKTTLLEAILARTGAVPRQRKTSDPNSIGDASPEARAHGMSVSANIADTTYLDDQFTFIDCPGSIEFQHESSLALTICDAAIVVCEPDTKRLPALQLILKQLDDRGIPHFLFLNKIDSFMTPVRDIIPMLQPASVKPLVLRQIPIWENGVATGFVDLASERAYVYREQDTSEIIELPTGLKDRESEARYQMLEQLADYDDELLEQLLSDVEPSRDRVFDDLSEDLRKGVICPVLLGSAEHGNGINRLLKALRHEVPAVAKTAQRLGVADTDSAAFIFKTVHSPHGGKMSVARVLTGSLTDGAVLRGAQGQEERISGLFRLMGEDTTKCDAAAAGDTVGLGRVDGLATGETVTTSKTPVVQIEAPEPPQPVYGTGLGLKDCKDEVKLTTALGKLMEEDPSLQVEHSRDTNQIVLLGQGEMHLRVALERLERKFSVAVDRIKRQIAYKETVRKPTEIRGRHKKQSGGHGQFGDVVIEISPQPRGTGFSFNEKITGGAVPKQFIPSVEIGVKDFMQRGPLGFPVVDISVTLKDGSYHSVDSSDMAFRQAARLAMADGMPKCSPVLLEPIMAVSIAVPSEATAKVNGMIPQRRGQILGYDARPGWPGWDVLEAHIPAAEMEDLIIELRSATAGVGSYSARFDHLAELTGKLADHAITDQMHATA
ncbi:Elongation factor G-like protein [Candidatus Filomicrobium marinum]|uniref:Elongation factor G n=1 Tax=Candidatus Filomicrobium marinum TaxID=1608628 RepID=A0A0D6JGT5_9HYPH|nr:elongation factor G [Candidatus Filomicrobium marinum]CFX49553.1 Elongation factor G-like protein [Candidatus Filomicrobium marinum]CPR20324.1 Elongation factor G-like protein [Candidatus Filomicrobium marinum]